jgi:aspartyl-tRNA(Asn)/glutamyl-tRNA(Gln) amidotransferase subunit A
MPTLAVEPFPIEQFAPLYLQEQPLRSRILAWFLTYPFNMLNFVPAASIPCGFTRAGLPVGLQIVGRPGRDADVLQLAAAFERARPWANNRPALALAASSVRNLGSTAFWCGK